MLAVWNQRYEPVANNLALSALVAALPVIVLLGLLGLFAGMASDRRIQVLLVAFCFGAFIEGRSPPRARSSNRYLGATGQVVSRDISTPTQPQVELTFQLEG